jgi:acyl carrier protein
MSPISNDTILGGIRAELDHMKIPHGFDAEPATTWVDLDVDSLDLVELVNALEDRFHVRIPQCVLKSVVSVGDAIDVIRSLREMPLAA